MRLRIGLVLAIGLVVSACASPIGRSVPECESIGATLVLEVQSVPGSAYVSCINGLKTGWDYRHLEARSGRSVFSLDSDRWGDGFVKVESVLSCNVGDAKEASVEDLPIQLFKDVVSETTVDIVVVPEGTAEITLYYAADVKAGLDDLSIKGRAAEVSVSMSKESTADRASKAAATGAHVIVVSIGDAEEGTLTLILDGQQLEFEGDLDQAIDAIEDAETESSYRGNWYYVFNGGCIVYTFNAEGPGVDTIETDIDLALGIFDADALRQVARDAGYRLP